MQGRRPAALAVFLLLQSVAAVFFVGDVIADLIADPASTHTIYEAIVVLALLAGMVLGAIELRQTMQRLARQDQALAVAAGALSGVIAAQFDIWGLTPAECDVGTLALKGLDVAEIAAMRGAAAGTVRAQLTHIYAKAGVSGRAQFAAFFVEDLMDGALIRKTTRSAGEAGAH